MYDKNFAKKYYEEKLVEKEEILNPLLKEILNNGKWKRLIDLGCGSGYYTRIFANKNRKIIGIDSNINQLKIARKIEEATSLGIEYIESNLANIKEVKSNSFDVALLTYVLVEIPDKKVIKKIFHEAHRVLKKGGFLIISQVHPHNINKNSITVKKKLLNKKDNYFSNGAQAVSKVLLKNGKHLIFKDDYHWTLEFLLNSLSDTGFNLREIKEGAYKEEYPTHIVIVEQK